MPVMSAFRGERQEGHSKFQACQGYTVRSCLNKTKTGGQENGLASKDICCARVET